MRYLVIDRSTRCPSLAVFDDSAPVVEYVWQGEPTRSPEWLADVDRLLADRAISAESLSCFVCGLGPGSFSGIRACLAALSGLALPGGKPVYGVASAAALALGQLERGPLVTVVGDARRSRLWCVTYKMDAATQKLRLADGREPTHTAADFQLVPAEALFAAVPHGTCVVSSDWERLEPVLRSSFDASRLVQQALFPKAADLVSLALNSSSSRVLEPLPIYLHPAVATTESHPVCP